MLSDFINLTWAPKPTPNSWPPSSSNGQRSHLRTSSRVPSLLQFYNFTCKTAKHNNQSAKTGLTLTSENFYRSGLKQQHRRPAGCCCGYGVSRVLPGSQYFKVISTTLYEKSNVILARILEIHKKFLCNLSLLIYFFVP